MSKGNIIHENERFVTIVTWKTSNIKTGQMSQIWILNKNINPVESVKTGFDAVSNCSGCPFANGMGCYVNVGQAPLAVFKAWQRGVYERLGISELSEAFKGKYVRFGAYGNPSLIPLEIIKPIAKASKGWTGYFHNWHLMSKERALAYGQFFMASTETEESRIKALAMGLRVFHVSPDQPKDFIECPSDSRGIQCKDCRLCDGLNKRAKNIWINPHGSKKSKAIAQAIA
jgi:hypothetical protein